jgi:YVTN family beta-propeller protein
MDAHTNTVVETIAVGPRPGRIAIGEGAVWVVNRGDHSVTRIDPATNKVVATIAVGHGIGAGDIAVGAGAVWLSAPGTPLVRLDPATNRAAQVFTGDGGGAVAVAFGSVWVAAGPAVTWRLDPALLTALRP